MTIASHTALPRLLAEWGCSHADAAVDPAIAQVFARRLLDFSANVVGGAGVPACRAFDSHAAGSAGRVELPGGGWADAASAALAYAATSHSLECDDTHQPSSTHPGTVVFGAALPLAAELGLTLGDMVSPVVVGYEVMCRLGQAAAPVEQYSRGFHPTGTCGAFGAAVAAALLLELDADGVATALGLAASVSSGSMSFLAGGGSSKLLNAGHAARAGVEVARLAALGVDGPEEAIAGPHGFLAGHSAPGSGGVVVPPSAGEALAIERTSVKAHGCCRYEQGPIDGILALRAEHGLRAQDVAHVDIAMLEAGWSIVAEPLEEKRRPRTVVESQFSMPFGAALALACGRATPLDHTLENLADPEIVRLMGLVECHRAPDLDALFPARWPARVRVELRDRTSLERSVDFPKGDPENPFSDDELVDKLRAMAPEVDHDIVSTFATTVLESGLDAIPASAITASYASMWPSVLGRAAA